MRGGNNGRYGNHELVLWIAAKHAKCNELPAQLKLLITLVVRKLIGKKIENTVRSRGFLTNQFSFP